MPDEKRCVVFVGASSSSAVERRRLGEAPHARLALSVPYIVCGYACGVVARGLGWGRLVDGIARSLEYLICLFAIDSSAESSSFARSFVCVVRFGSFVGCLVLGGDDGNADGDGGVVC